MERYFITRIELHNLPQAPSSLNIYEKLHEELLKQKFRKQIAATDNNIYELPDAVYLSQTNEDKQSFNAGDVRTLAEFAISETIAFVKKYSPFTNMRGSILVTEAAEGPQIYWMGLTKI